MNVRDIIGGSPLAVLLRLAILSLIVGFVLSLFGITPSNFFYSLDLLARYVYDLGFEAVEWVFQYLALGAMVVVPVWLLLRFLRGVPAKPDKPSET